MSLWIPEEDLETLMYVTTHDALLRFYTLIDTMYRILYGEVDTS